MPEAPTQVPALIVNNPDLTTTGPEGYRKHVENILAAHWPDVEVTIAPTSNAGQPRETLTEAQLEVLNHGRWLLSDRDLPETEDYRRGVIEMLAVQMFGDVSLTERVAVHLDPWPPVDDVTLATLGHLVVKTLRAAPLNTPPIETLGAIQQAARDLQIVFSI